jgi:Domain of unknown function (DUF4115)
MTVAVIVLLALVAAIVAGATWRRTVDERRSVKDHQRTLETLRQLPERRVEGASAPVPTTPEASSPPRDKQAASEETAAETPSTPPAELASSSQGLQTGERLVSGEGRAVLGDGTPARPVVLDDTGPTVLARYQDPTAVTWASRPDVATVSVPRVSRRSPLRAETISSPVEASSRRGRFRSRPVAMVAAAGIAMAAVIALALTFSSSSVPHASTGPSHSSPSPSKHGSRSAPVVNPSSSSTSAATYASPRGPFTVTLDASAPCWVYATDAANRTVIWTATLAGGQQHTISATSTLVVRLGSSNVTVSLDGKPVQFPTGFQVPFDMTFKQS